MARVLVTGGAGFIGYHVVRELLERGYEVRVLDNLSRSSYREVERLCELVRADVRDPGALMRALRGCEAVVHLAALISVEESMREPRLYHEVNAGGTLNVVICSLKAGVRKLVYASSAAVYGEPVSLPVTEDHPTRPSSVYGASKLAGESYAMAFGHRMRVTVLRLFNVYGSLRRVTPSAVEIFMGRMLRGDPVTVYGDGRQTRDLIHVLDVARAFALAVEGDHPGVFNVASGRPVEILDLVRAIASVVGVKARVVHRPPRPGEIRHSYASIERIRREMGFEPRISLEEGLRLTLGTAS